MGVFVDAGLAEHQYWTGLLCILPDDPLRPAPLRLRPGDNHFRGVARSRIGWNPSIDIDGEDYAVWQAVQARPWNRHHRSARGKHGNQDVVDATGASVPALCALAARKGYVLAAWNRHGYNLIFVRSDLVNDRVFARAYPFRPEALPGGR